MLSWMKGSYWRRLKKEKKNSDVTVRLRYQSSCTMMERSWETLHLMSLRSGKSIPTSLLK